MSFRNLLCAGAVLCLITAPGLAFSQPPVRYQDTDAATGAQIGVPDSPGTPLPIRGQTTPVAGTFTTPAGTSAYAAGNLIANSATNTLVVPMQFNACLVNGGNGAVTGVRVETADTGFAGKAVILKLHKTAPTYANGDHAAWLTTNSAALPPTTITLSEHYSDEEKGFGTPDNNGVVNARTLFGFDCGAGSQLIYGELVAGPGTSGAITPQGAKLFTVILEVVH